MEVAGRRIWPWLVSLDPRSRLVHRFLHSSAVGGCSIGEGLDPRRSGEAQRQPRQAPTGSPRRKPRLELEPNHGRQVSMTKPTLAHSG